MINNDDVQAIEGIKEHLLFDDDEANFNLNDEASQYFLLSISALDMAARYLKLAIIKK